jgi:methylthioxylose transferase
VASGAVFGMALLLTYGTGAVLVIPALAALALAWSSWRRLAALASWAALGVAVPLAASALAGFWWLDGLDATRQAYWSGVGGDRPGLYLTLVGNPAALALATGPAVAAGLAGVLARTRVEWRPALLPGAALAAVLLANLSQLSRGEVERIWLPFIPWLALAAPGDRRAWIAAQVGLALVLQVALTSPW